MSTPPPLEVLLEQLASEKPDYKWAVCDRADGPGFVAWLEARGVSAPQNRSFKRWRAGEDASVWAVDHALTKAGLCLFEVPEDLWKEEG